MKLSVLLISYNHSEYIGKCLQSIVSQNVNFSFEIVIGDDCSTDNTTNILLEYKNKYPNMIVLETKMENVGFIQNFSDALKKCRGEYIAYIDGDDEMLPSKLQKQVDFLDKHQDCNIVTHNMSVVDSSGNRIRLMSEQEFPTKANIDYLLTNGMFFSNGSKMFRTDSLPQDGVDEFVKRIPDWLICLQNTILGKIAYINEVLGVYRLHQGSFTDVNKRIPQKILEEKLYIINKMKDNVHNLESIAVARSKAFFIAANELLLMSDFVGYRKNIKKSFECGYFFNRFHVFLYYCRLLPWLAKKIIEIKTS